MVRGDPSVARARRAAAAAATMGESTPPLMNTAAGGTARSSIAWSSSARKVDVSRWSS
jgi:hypothetical protein